MVKILAQFLYKNKLFNLKIIQTNAKHPLALAPTKSMISCSKHFKKIHASKKNPLVAGFFISMNLASWPCGQ